MTLSGGEIIAVWGFFGGRSDEGVMKKWRITRNRAPSLNLYSAS